MLTKKPWVLVADRSQNTCTWWRFRPHSNHKTFHCLTQKVSKIFLEIKSGHEINIDWAIMIYGCSFKLFIHFMMWFWNSLNRCYDMNVFKTSNAEPLWNNLMTPMSQIDYMNVSVLNFIERFREDKMLCYAKCYIHI